MTPRILVLLSGAAPGRPAARLSGEATRALGVSDVALTAADLADYPLPFFEDGLAGDIPQNAKLLAQRLALQDAVLLVCPEIHAAPPPALVNAIDWIAHAAGAAERIGQPFARLVVALAIGGDARRSPQAASQLRATLGALGAEVMTLEFHLTSGEPGFDAKGRFADPADGERLDAFVDRLLDHARALARQP
ncbi:NADPH-dependent FMN reductase [Aureimonas sp. ME7]|uniref:NADPH-dependent FMN reductase n=1 Tax=Aureimonas sp. ME7 TaxID=2744252 RepID=UPI0015F66255|nr:NADPH-dependent FMN reductase [Aureimonas sp. ME7]